jgi:hypothetical protein
MGVIGYERSQECDDGLDQGIYRQLAQNFFNIQEKRSFQCDVTVHVRLGLVGKIQHLYIAD